MSFRLASKIPILTYHSIDESNSVISVSREAFRRQMSYLRRANYNTVSLKELAEGFGKNTVFAPKTIALTFDDGFRNFYTDALPVLDEFGFTATVFLVTDYCGKRNEWEAGTAIPLMDLLKWSEVKESIKRGIEFGAHTRTHPDLTRLAAAEAEREVVESKLAIEDRTGCEVTTFAYPFGRFNASVKRLAASNFDAAVSTNLGRARSDSDVFALKRVDAYYLSNQRLFDSMGSKRFDCYMGLRHGMRKLKSLIR